MKLSKNKIDIAKPKQNVLENSRCQNKSSKSPYTDTLNIIINTFIKKKIRLLKVCYEKKVVVLNVLRKVQLFKILEIEI